MGFPFQPANCGGCGCGPGCPPCAACPDFQWQDFDGNFHNMSCYSQAALSWVNGAIGGGTALLSPDPDTACVFDIACGALFRFDAAWDASVDPPTLTLTYYPSGCGGSSVTCGPLTPNPDVSGCFGNAFIFQYDITSAGCPDVWADSYTQFTITN